MSTIQEYFQTLPRAYQIVDVIKFPDGIKTHHEYCERIMLAGKINRLLIESKLSI